MKKAIQISIAILGLVVAVGGATGRTIHVPAEAMTIQAGIDLAEAGDTVLVAPGVYTGAGNWDLSFGGRDLILRSESGAEATILDGTGSEAVYARVLTFSGESRDAVIDGFTIRNFTSGYYPCSGVLCEGSAAPVVRGCVFTANSGLARESVFTAWEHASPLLIECRFENNGDWSTSTPTILVIGAATLRMEGCIVARNNTGYCGGVFAEGVGASVELYRCEFSANHPRGINAWDARVTLEECTLAGNFSGYGGGAQLTDAVLRNCTIASNSGGYGGGGLYVPSGGDVLLERCLFSGNCGDPGPDIATRGSVRLICCAADSTEVVAQPGGTVEWIGPQVHTDPRLCAPASCEEWPSDGDYHIRSDSPCLPELNPCGQLIGALGVGCPGIPIGACCEGPVCRVTTWADCYTHEGIYVGDGSGCAPNPCVPIPVERTTWGQIKARFR